MSIHAKFQGRVSCFALSTAFEDFDLNTIENTKRLVEDNYLTGETKKTFDANGLAWDKPIPFPVLFDTLLEKEELLQPRFIDGIISNHPDSSEAPQAGLGEIKKSL